MRRRFTNSINVGTIGVCIYCGSRDSLTDEHIVPYSLGGRAYLKDASCPSCASITKRFEQYIARRVYGHLRIHSNIQTRRPKERPLELPVDITVHGSAARHVLPVKDHPFFVCVPVWKPPGILRGVFSQEEEDFPGVYGRSFFFYQDNYRETFGLKPGEDITFLTEPAQDFSQFSRAIAKIGYCMTIAKLDLTKSVHWLCQILFLENTQTSLHS